MYQKTFFIGALLVIISCISSAQKIVWRPLPNMPKAVRNTTAVRIDSCVFVLGGYGTEKWDGNFMYNMRSKTWETKASLLTGRSNMAAVAIDGKIYAIGGDKWKNNNEVYDPKTNSWSALAPMPTARQHIYGTVLDNKIHIIGGLAKGSFVSDNWEDTELLATHEVYDPATNTWDTLAPLPVPHHNVTLATIKGKIYAIGGNGDKTSVWTNFSTIYEYNPATNNWKDLGKIDLPFIENIAVDDSLIYLITPEYPDKSSSAIVQYNPATNTQKAFTKLNYVHNECAMAAYNGRLLVFGGATANFATDISKVFEGIIMDSIDYLGQTPPTDVPKVFAPGIVSVADRYEYGISFSPNGKEIFFTAEQPGEGLMRIVKNENKWSSPALANIRKTKVWEFEAFYTIAGDSLFFTSDDGGKQQFYYVSKTDTGWSESKKLNSEVNNDDIMWCSFSNNGNMYYTKTSDFSSYCSKKVKGVYLAGEKVTNGTHPYVSSDESFFLYNASGDIYIRFKSADGKSWQPAIKLNNKINTEYSETCPSLSPDGKYMFFSRYNDIGEKSDIYWVSTEFIEELKNSTNSVQQTFEQNIEVFPNPTNGITNISFGNLQYKKSAVEIINTDGKVIFSNSYQNISAATINLGDKTKGVYIFRVDIDGEIVSKKIVVK